MSTTVTLPEVSATIVRSAKHVVLTSRETMDNIARMTYEAIVARGLSRMRHIADGKLAEHSPRQWAHRPGGRPMKWKMALSKRVGVPFDESAITNYLLSEGKEPIVELDAHTCTITYNDTVYRVKEAAVVGGTTHIDTWCVLVETINGDEVWTVQSGYGAF